MKTIYVIKEKCKNNNGNQENKHIFLLNVFARKQKAEGIAQASGFKILAC